MAEHCRREREDRLGDRMRVRVEIVSVLDIAARDVDETHAVERQPFERSHLAVHRVRMQIRDVEQERTARRGGHLVEELALGHLMGAPHERARRVLEKQRHVGK